MRQLIWTHFVQVLPLKETLEREFYAQMCAVEGWSVLELSKRIDSMLY